MRLRLILGGLLPVLLSALLLAGFIPIGGDIGPASRDDGRDAIEALRSLGYLDWVEVRDGDVGKSGLVKADDIQDGTPRFILYKPRYSTDLRVINMSGDVVLSRSVNVSDEPLGLIKPAGDMGLYGIQEDEGLIKFCLNGSVLWRVKGRFHHEVIEGEDGFVYSLIRRPKNVVNAGETLYVLDDLIVKYAPDGGFMEEQSIYGLFHGHVSETQLSDLRDYLDGLGYGEIEFLADRPTELFHTNSISLIRDDVGGLFNKGDLLISIKNLDTIAVLDKEDYGVKWIWGKGVLENQHNPSQLSNGNIIVFDNGCKFERPHSRIIEVDPVKRGIVWEYSPEDTGVFFSRYMGGVEEIDAGKYLVTESDRGRLFMLDSKGEILWEYYLPDMDETKRATLYRSHPLTGHEITLLSCSWNYSAKKS